MNSRIFTHRLAVLLTLSLPIALLQTRAAWNPPQGTAPPPAVVTFFPWDVEPPSSSPGFGPMPKLVLGSDGALYGVMTGGGAGFGTLFRFQPDGSFTQLYVFNASDGSMLGPGSSPYNNASTLNVPMIALGADGAIYGCSYYGGNFDSGTLFRFQPDGTFTKLHDFASFVGDGSYPDTGLVLGPDGALYGTTTYGGTFGNGAVFRVDTNGVNSIFHSFAYEDGGLFNVTYDGAFCPDSALVVGPDGALYGCTPSGGGANGTIFRLQIDGTFAKLHDFTDGEGGKSALVVGADGALYGLSSSSIFKITIDGVFTKLYDVRFYDSGYPAMVAAPDGALYGSTLLTPSGESCLFRVETNGTVTILQHLLNAGPVIGPMVIGPDGLAYGTAPQNGGTLFKLDASGALTELYEFAPGTQGSSPAGLTLGPDNAFYGGAGSLFKLVLPFTRPLLQNLSPSQTVLGSGDTTITLSGVGFMSGVRAFFGATEISVSYIGTTQLQVVVPASSLPSPADFATAPVTVLNPGGGLSKPLPFTVVAASVSGSVDQVQSGVAGPGETATVQAAPSDTSSGGVSATLQNTSGSSSATVTAASYNQNPTPAPAFEAGGGFVDLQVSGATATDQLTSSFYYPQTVTGAAETALTLQFFNGAQWITVLSSGGLAPAKSTTDNLDGTVSGGRFQVVFDDTSTPKLTQLNGTVFAVAVPESTPPSISCPNISLSCDTSLLGPVTYPQPIVSDNVDPSPRVTYSIPSGTGFRIGTTTVTATATDAAGNHSSTTFTVTRAPLQFAGFLSPVGGADSTGGSFSAPLRTFKAGSTVPVKFTAQCGSTAITTGIHRLQAIKYTNATTAGTPIDATPQGAASTGDQFQYSSGQWQFNLDTKATGMTTGIWLLQATLSDGSQHSAWIQLK